MTAPRTWTVTIPAPGGKVHSVNDDHRAGRWRVANNRKTARRAGYWYAWGERIPPLSRAQLSAIIRIRGWANADPQNYPGGSTMKGIIDGLVDARVIPDDNAKYLTVAMPVIGPPKAPRQYEIELTITEVPA